MNTKTMIAALAAVIAVGGAFADKVTMKSGSVVTGTAGVMRDGKLQFKSDDLGDLEIDIKNVAKLESSGDHVVQYTDMTKETKPLTVIDGDFAETSGEKLDMTRVKAIDPEIQSWHGSVNFTGTATRGNTVGESATVVADIAKRWDYDRLTADAGYFFAQSGDSKQSKQKTTSRFEAQAQEDHFWTGEGFYTYLNGKYEFDRIMDLEYRWRVGAGIGYQWLENEDFGFGKTSFNQELGMSYVGEKYEHVDDDNYGTFRYAHHFAWEIAAIENLSFTHNFEWLPQVDEWEDNYLIDADAGITYAFSANWQLIAKAEWDYKKKVGPGVKHSDLRYILGIGYKW